MNILHAKYALEVAKLGSLSKAAESLLVAQPNISRSIKELEADLGITIFQRTPSGTLLTADGEVFIEYAKSILKRIDEVERIYRRGTHKKQELSVSATRAGYISEALADFSKGIAGSPTEISYKEADTQETISALINDDYKLGIIRYADSYDKFFKGMLEEKGFEYEMIAEFSYSILASKDSPLAKLSEITYTDLVGLIELTDEDPYAPVLPTAKIPGEWVTEGAEQRMLVHERSAQLDLLGANPRTFKWCALTPSRLLERYALVELPCPEEKKIYKDVLIWRKGYKLSQLDNDFITAVCASRRRNAR